MKFVKLTQFYMHKAEPVYINMSQVESIFNKTDEDGKVIGSILVMPSMGSLDSGIQVKETFDEIMNLLYWEEIDGQPKQD